MNKKLISLLVAICLVIGLLPVASIAANPEPKTAKLAIKQSSNTLEVTEGEDPIYGKSVEFDAYTSTGKSMGKGYDFTTENVSTTDWNLKFEYPAGGQPTLTLKNFKLVLAQENGNPLFIDSGNGIYTSVEDTSVGIASKSQAIDLKIVLQDENVIRTTNGIIQADASTSNKFNSITIVGENGGSLTGSGKAIGIRSKYGVPVTIQNAVVNLTANSATATAAPIYVKNADITIENSTLNFNNLKTTGTVCAIHAEGSGAINITNSNLELTATGNAFNKTPTLSAGWTATAGDDATSSVAVTDAAVLASKKYVKVTYPQPEPSTEATSEPTSAPTTEATTEATTAPTVPSAGSTLPSAVSVKIAGKTLSINKYETAVYTANATSQIKDTAGDLFDVIGQSVTTDENNWNTKFVWHVGDDAPTLYLDGMIVDDYNEEASKWRNYPNKPTDPAYTTAIEILAGQKVKIVLTGEDSLIKCRFGINFKSDLEIKSVDTAKLTVRNINTAISSHSVENASLTIDANLDFVVDSYYTGSVNSAIIYTYKSDLIINGGNITCNTNATNYICSIYAKDGGDVIINAGNISAHGVAGNSPTNGTIQANAGKVIINGGTVTPTTRIAVCLYGGNGLEINGGTVNLNSPYYGANAGTNGQIAINGGTVEIVAVDGAFYREPVLGAGISGIVGPNAQDVYAFRPGTDDYRAKYLKTGAGVADGAPTKPMPTTRPTTAPTTPAPSASAPASSAPTGAPTVPPTYGDPLAASVSVKIAGKTLTIKHYDTAVYTANSTSKIKDTEGVLFDVVGQSVTTDQNNWNTKFIWHAGDDAPTLYLDGMIVDDYNEESSKWRNYPNKPTDAAYTTAIEILAGQKVKIVLTGEDSLVKCRFGINFKSDLEIKSKDTTKLTIHNLTTAISSHSVENASVTIDANLDLIINSYYTGSVNSGIIYTYKSDLIINGGTISCMTNETNYICGIFAKDGGDVIINGGKIKSQSVAGASGTTAAILSSHGKVIINGGEVEPIPANNQGIYALQGIEVNGGTVKLYAPMNGLSAGTKELDSPITINGGTVEVISGSGAFSKKPILGEGVTGYAGDNYKYAQTYNPEKDYKAKYVKIGLNVAEPDPSDMPTLPGADPNRPGENPSAPEVEPTVSPTAAPNMKLPKAVSVNVAGVDLRITKFDQPVYTVNTPKEFKDTAGNLFEVMTQAITTDENNWNAKFVWPASEPVPILYINGLIIDDYNEEAEKWRAYSNKPTDAAYTTAIAVPSGQYMRIVATGEDSQFKTRFGINFKSKLRLESDDDTKLNLWNLSGTINGSVGMPLVVDANLDVFLVSYYTGTVSQGMMTNQADITINGGNINIDFGYDNYSVAITARDGGNVTINGGNLTVNGVVGCAAGNGTIQSQEKIIINGGTINATTKKAVAMYAKRGIEINGGIVNITSPWYGINAGNEIVFNGGTTTIIAQNAVYTTPTVIVGSGVFAYAGAGPRSADVFDGSDQKLARKPWMFITDDESKKIVMEEEEEEEEEIFDPTEAPTESTEPTASDATAETGATETTVPDATVPEDETPEDEIPEEEIPEEDNNNYYGVTPNLDITEGISEEIPDALIDMGIDSVDVIREILVENIWAVDDYSDYFAFFDIKLMYHDGEDWVEASEEHYPDEGYITVMLPYPEGTDMDTPFTAVHMYTSDAFGLTPGEVELLAPVNTDEGILVELTGLSPVAIAWERLLDEENPPTGDTGIGLYIALMVVAVLGMAGTVILSNKKKRKA